MIITKIGGGEAINLTGIIADLAELQEPAVIVHGANALRDGIAQQLRIEKKILTSISGYTSVYSDKQAIDVILMTYAGLRNKRIVELCQQNGINAVGLSGIDGKMIQGERNRGIRVCENGKKLIKRDFSGKPKSINVSLMRLLLENGYTPVLCIPILDENNTAINSENDDVVTQIQSVLHADKIFQFIEAPGFLLDPHDPDSLVPRLSASEIEKREQQVEGRMKRKMLALRKLFEWGSTEVIIADGRIEHPLRSALKGKGTRIILNENHD